MTHRYGAGAACFDGLMRQTHRWERVAQFDGLKKDLQKLEAKNYKATWNGNDKL